MFSVRRVVSKYQKNRIKISFGNAIYTVRKINFDRETTTPPSNDVLSKNPKFCYKEPGVTKQKLKVARGKYNI